jgi:hypothetical protein
MKFSNLFLFLILILVFSVGCSSREYIDVYAPISTFELKKIKININSKFPKTIMIKDQKKIIEFVNDLNFSIEDGFYKSTEKLDIITLYYKHENKMFYTNGKRFSNNGSNDLFFELNEKYLSFWK